MSTTAFPAALEIPRPAVKIRVSILVLPFFCTLHLWSAEANSRAEEIQQARLAKAEQLEKPARGKVEAFLLGMEDGEFLEKITAEVGGVGPVFGGLATSQGFALGPGFTTGENFIFRMSGRASSAKAYLFEAGLAMPNLAGGKIEVDLEAIHRNFPRLEYYGPGPDSEKGSRSVYRLEGPSFDARVGVRATRSLKLGATGGYIKVNVGPGTRTGVSSTHEAFAATEVPGLEVQTDYWRGGTFIEFDYRDIPGGNSRSGGYYTAQFLYYDDQGVGRYNFRQFDMEGQQYFPLFNGKRVIALRARTVMTWSIEGQSVPFYFQPHIGGADDLRGFRPYRFYDDNHIVANLEYRWESFSGLDMVLFFDAGKVVPRRSQINFHDLEASAGFGFRFNQRNRTFLRLDIGFSREGMQAWFKFNSPF